jgi:hypothetical protein
LFLSPSKSCGHSRCSFGSLFHFPGCTLPLANPGTFLVLAIFCSLSFVLRPAELPALV